MADIVSVAESRRAESVGREIVVQGWVRTRRDSKAGFSFIELNDGSCFGNVQIIAEASLPNYESEIKRLAPGACASVAGLVKASPGKGQATEIQAASIVVHGLADAEAYPLQKKGHSFEFLRTIAHLRPRTNTFGAVARVRNRVCNSIHQYFQEQGFIYVHTPIITTSDCEGAGAMFQVTSLDPAKNAEGGKGIDFSNDFFGRPAFLTVSGQLEAETFACALSKTYTFGPTFRAENSNTPRHLAEFWMIEPEVAFCDLWGDMDLAEGLLKRIFRDVLVWESLQPSFVGLRSAVSMALVIVIVAEMFIGSENGLGHAIIDAQQVLNVKTMYAAILATGILGYALNVVFLMVERRIVHWSGR